jgi:hypothetical protein
VQTAVASDEKLTGNPEDAVADTLNGAASTVLLLNGPKVML